MCPTASARRRTRAWASATCTASGSGGVGLQQLRDRAFELGEALVDLDHLVGGDRVGGVDVRQALRPLRAALAAVEEKAVRVGAEGEDGGAFQGPATVALALV